MLANSLFYSKFLLIIFIIIGNFVENLLVMSFLLNCFLKFLREETLALRLLVQCCCTVMGLPSAWCWAFGDVDVAAGFGRGAGLGSDKATSLSICFCGEAVVSPPPFSCCIKSSRVMVDVGCGGGLARVCIQSLYIFSFFV